MGDIAGKHGAARVEPLMRGSAADEGTSADVPPLRVCVTRALERYFEQLDGETPSELYAMVLNEVEEPLLETVMSKAAGNQCRAAAMLGMNRGTLRKKLKQHGLL